MYRYMFDPILRVFIDVDSTCRCNNKVPEYNPRVKKTVRRLVVSQLWANKKNINVLNRKYFD